MSAPESGSRWPGGTANLRRTGPFVEALRTRRADVGALARWVERVLRPGSTPVANALGELRHGVHPWLLRGHPPRALVASSFDEQQVSAIVHEPDVGLLAALPRQLHEPASAHLLPPELRIVQTVEAWAKDSDHRAATVERQPKEQRDEQLFTPQVPDTDE